MIRSVVYFHLILVSNDEFFNSGIHCVSFLVKIEQKLHKGQGFFTVESQIFASKCIFRGIFSSIIILFTLIYFIKGYPTELKDSLFEAFNFLVCFHTK
jgi:hypothetical protein